MNSSWRIIYEPLARKQLNGLDPQIALRIVRGLERAVARGDPRHLFERLHGDLAGLNRYRVGDYRVVVRLQLEVVTVVVLRLGHRREIYR